MRYIETRLARTRASRRRPARDVPDILLLLSEELAVVDNLSGKLSLIVYADPATPDAYAQRARAARGAARASCASR